MASLARVHRLSVLNILLLSLFSLNLNTAFAQLRNNGTSDPQMNRLAQVKASRDGQQSDFTCGPNKECINGACCGEDGWCGYGPNYCGDGCQSNCDAKAECGEFAADPGQTCPLNVCCSQHGFCGTTSEFCDEGCQSNCEDPSPGGSPSNPRDIIIGYWEAWNMDKPCGTMGPGAIPVHMLTHLFVSFGYINSNWEVTNMDGVDPEIFKTIGNVKARNPDLKVVIALGGWTFSDPGPWQAIFPTMAGSKENRATFIRNLMGFMSEYGYDGVDFDWEYPGADDRGGSEGDGDNYVLLVKELREAINASGREYIITFTAPSSYWYLRHFDLKGMEEHVDWINLMSYDLHGVWDASNPIGNQVLAHTNLTEIDQALDLFWRVGVEPSSVVLGLGFYGRSFELESSSCWKPGCAFKGPGAEGRCSRTAGILAYNEVMEILAKTGGKPYFDEDAAAKYMVYSGHSWISYDDAETFQLKIDYAAQIGLRGLMIWAIDLDTGTLDALSAVTGDTVIPGSNSPFTLTDLENLFPPELLPSKDATTNWGLINFGHDANGGAVDPDQTGFGFILITGESHAMTSLKRRKDNPEPLIFLSCPDNVSQQDIDQPQTARVVCTSQNVEACFQILERGVEDTVVEMPDNCGANSFVRAISLEKSAGELSLHAIEKLNRTDTNMIVAVDQTVPAVKGRRAPTSEVFDFKFDLNVRKKRQDGSKLSLRVDFSNTNGYWGAAVDSPPAGSSSSSNGGKDKRYWNPSHADWRNLYSSAQDIMVPDWVRDVTIKETINQPLFWDQVSDCEIEDEDYYKGYGAHVEGTMDVKFTLGFTMVAEIGEDLDVKEANGWMKVDGEADLTYSHGGVGKVDLSSNDHSNPAYSKLEPTAHTAWGTGIGGRDIWFEPYWKLDFMLAAFNDTEGGSGSPSGPYFDGQLTSRVKQDFGGYQINFPPNEEDQEGSRNVDRRDNEISIPASLNVVNNLNSNGGRLAMSTFFTFGMKIILTYDVPGTDRRWDLADIKGHYNTLVQHTLRTPLGSPEACVDTSISTLGFQSYEIDEDNTLGWGEHEAMPYVVQDSQSPGESCYAEQPSIGEDNFWGYGPDELVDPTTYLEAGEHFGEESENVFKCSTCVQCGKEEEEKVPCCGCVNMNLLFPNYEDIPSCSSCNEDDNSDGAWPGDVSRLRLTENDERDLNLAAGLNADGSDPDADPELFSRDDWVATMSSKYVSACGQGASNRYWLTPSTGYGYPAFPANPKNDWDGIENGRWDAISKYWGNSSSVCTNWNTEALMPHDTAWVNFVEVRDRYQTEHVFEGQLIGDFFTMWLDQGHINNQDPEPSNPTPKAPCSFTRQYFLEWQSGFPWQLDGEERSFIHLMLAELGSEAHKDRLTILKARPNRMKGSMFTGNQPSSWLTYARMSPDAQLMATKDMGTVFTYLNHGEVWDAFCGTYEAIYDLLGEWQDWWNANGSGYTPPNMQDEWKEYIETVLTSLVRRGRASFDLQYELAMIRVGDSLLSAIFFRTQWLLNILNRDKIKIDGRCNNLDAIVVNT